MPEYGRVVLTLSNVLLPPEKLYPNPTPSIIEGLPYDVEYDLRLIGCELIQSACLLLKLPQTAVATGQVLFHRYYYSSSFVRRPMEIFAMACTNLAAKIEENARRIRDVINVFHHIKQVRSGKTIRPLLVDQAYIDRKGEVIKAERRVLKELGFCVYVKHPHKMITMYLKVLEKEREKNLVQTAWNYMNDSLRTDIFLRFTPETIACACIDLAARTLQIALPKNPPWYIIFGAKHDEIHFIMIAILRLYNHRPKSLDDLEKNVNTLREKREDERRKLRPDTSQPVELGNDSPSQQQIAQNSIVSSVVSTTMTVVQQQQHIATVISTIQETTNVTTTATTNGKVIKKHDKGSSIESSTVNQHRHHHSRRKRSGTRSRSSSRSSSHSSTRRLHKKKKTTHRSRSRSRSSTPKRRKHQKDKRHRSRSSNHRKKDRKRRSRSSSSEESPYSKSNNKHPLSTKDTNHNLHQRSHHHHHSSKHSNGVSSSSSSHKKLKH
ncbi:unnamed protein product [Rotaria socialis]|uniref:Cyclin-like domain-containing protein n=2 Tax=Rotaria socialis TaxID=392032 RepID=A0A818TB13_9BILA|nr:unnamed protein product [Rotaria socialis]CAF3752115.1 unnamed protein product [Rotaria socialis]CAF4218135.1 unnamed protein product [Rotaria socialis]CAF4474344.1 unnamed protein product [Rotaria socialis]